MTRARDVSTPTALVLIKSQVIGTAVSSVTVTDAFSATYDNYYVTITGGSGSASNRLIMTLGGSTAGYYYGGQSVQWNGTLATRNGNNVSSFEYAGTMNTACVNCQISFFSPFLATKTSVSNTFNYVESGNGGGIIGGFHDSATSYSAFTVSTISGTITGSTIRVYGYRK